MYIICNVPSTNGLALEEISVAGSLTSIKNEKRPRMDLWGTPAATSAQLETFPFNTTSASYLLKNHPKVPSDFPEYHFVLILK